MLPEALEARISDTLAGLQQAGQYKTLHSLTSPMGPVATVDGRETLVLCSNDYLGLANHPAVVEASAATLRQYGAGTASVRFICGTFEIHERLEAAIAGLVGSSAALTFVSCWNANEALFPTLVSAGDTIISDALNHASIIDSVRQVRDASKVVYPHNDLSELERALSAAAGGTTWVVTDGVFSMEGDLAPLDEIAQLCRIHGAVLVVDDSHGVGVLGDTGRGTPEHFDLLGNVDVLTGTLGKTLGGAAGGYVAASARVIELLTQRARPSLFSNALPPSVAAGATAAIETLEAEPERVERLRENTSRIRQGLRALGYDCPDTPSAIVPIILGDADRVRRFSDRLLELGILVVGFTYPVVPEGEARLRLQVSAALEDDHISAVLDAFAKL